MSKESSTNDLVLQARGTDALQEESKSIMESVSVSAPVSESFYDVFNSQQEQSQTSSSN